MDYNIEKINKIKSKGLFGNLIEVGCGCPVYSELCNHPNTASKIVNWTFSPNNWEWSKDHYNHGNSRAISIEVAYNYISNAVSKITYNKENPINFILSNTIQIANTEDVQTHGWFALYSFLPNSSNLKFYHFTIDGFRSRKEYIELIAQIGLDILASANNIEELDNGYIDIISDDTNKFNIKDTLTSIVNSKLNIEHYHNTSTVFKANGTIERLNTLLRNTVDNLIVFKGSFNPIHDQHLFLLNSIKEKISGTTVFCISINNRDKNKKVDLESIMNRIQIINQLGYDVIVDCFGEYHYSYTTLINNIDFKNIKLHYIMGGDILKRFLIDEHVGVDNHSYNTYMINNFNTKWSYCNFWWEKRPGVDDFVVFDELKNIHLLDIENKELSSTLIRKLIEDKNIEELKKYVSQELIDLYLNTYGKS